LLIKYLSLKIPLLRGEKSNGKRKALFSWARGVFSGPGMSPVNTPLIHSLNARESVPSPEGKQKKPLPKILGWGRFSEEAL